MMIWESERQQYIKLTEGLNRSLFSGWGPCSLIFGQTCLHWCGWWEEEGIYTLIFFPPNICLMLKSSCKSVWVYGAIQVTNEGLQQGYCVVPSAKRFLLLYSFLKRNLSKKIMVFFSSCNSVKFHSELLRYIKIECCDIHGKQKQQKRTSTFFEFCEAKTGILLCTDVAARGLDIPAVVCCFTSLHPLPVQSLVHWLESVYEIGGENLFHCFSFSFLRFSGVGDFLLGVCGGGGGLKEIFNQRKKKCCWCSIRSASIILSCYHM